MILKRGVILLVFLLVPFAYAIEYYADIDIEVDSAGFVNIEGETNHPNLITENNQSYTSKKQSSWLLEIKKDEVFSDYVYRVRLPSSASVNYVKSSGNFRIENDNGNIMINGFGQDEKMSIIIQYSLKKEDENNLIYVFIIAILIIIGFVVLTLIKKKKVKLDKPPEKKEATYDITGLSIRQKEIMDLLLKENKPLTQAKIQKEIDIPKASVSRNLKSLELKGLIEKEKAGMTVMIKLKR